jgi:hypothetical protein
VVAIWLNDGTGRFERANPSPQVPDWRASSPDLTGSNGADTGACDVLSRPGAAGLAAARAGGDVPLPVFPLVTCGAFRTARASLSALRPRAPPLAST